MARRNSNNAITLFPFLAVLVCTMGALILLLLVTTRRIRQDLETPNAQQGIVINEGEDAELFQSLDSQSDQFSSMPAVPNSGTDHAGVLPQTTQNPNPDQQDDSEPEVAIHFGEIFDEWSSGGQTSLPAGISRVEDLRMRLAEETDRQTTLQKQIAKVRSQLNTAESKSVYADVDKLNMLRNQQSALTRQLKDKQTLLSDLRSELERTSEKTEDAEALLQARESALISLRELVKHAESVTGTDSTVIDFTNSTGTQRSPVVIDVTESAFEFLPSNIEVSRDDLRGFPANDNPLLAGVMAVHSHRFPDSVTVKPYVLLLVRPNGSLMFYSAQRTLSEAGIHFGYELIEQDRQIATGASSDGERAAVHKSITAAMDRRREMYGPMMAEIEAAREAPRREMRVMPDGRILFEEDAAEGNNGRFYAGGKSLPSRDYAQRDGSGNAIFAPPVQRPPVLSNAIEQMPEHDRIPADAADSDALPETVPAPQAPDFSAEGQSIPERNEFPAFVTGPVPSARAGAQPDSEGGESPPSKNESNAEQSLDSFERTAEKSDEESQRSDRTDSHERFDWPETVTAGADRETRTVEPPENQAAVTFGTRSSFDDQKLLAEQDASQAFLARTEPGNRHVESESLPDPHLKTLFSTSLANDPALAGYHRVDVCITRQSVTVGQQPPVDIEGRTPQQILEITLEGLAIEIQRLPDAEREGAIPTVDYTVGSGAGPIQRRLEVALQRMDVPTRTAINAPGSTAVEPRVSHPSTESEVLKEPAEPIEAANTGMKGWRRSI